MTSPPSFTVRAATDNDGQFLWDLNESVMRPYIEVSAVWDRGWQEKQFRDRFAANRWRVIISSEGADIGGYAVDRRSEMNVLTDIYLLPQYQRQGIGGFIVAGLIAEAAQNGRRLVLLVHKDNPNARKLYERLEMRVVGEMGDRFIMIS